jgi:transcriptional regulator with XRE-family HTH domain
LQIFRSPNPSEDIREKALEMRRQGYTQEQVARELGVDERTIRNWEKSEPEKPAKIAGFSGNPTPTPSEEETDDPVLARLHLQNQSLNVRKIKKVSLYN